MPLSKKRNSTRMDNLCNSMMDYHRELVKVNAGINSFKDLMVFDVFQVSFNRSHHGNTGEQNWLLFEIKSKLLSE